MSTFFPCISKRKREPVTVPAAPKNVKVAILFPPRESLEHTYLHKRTKTESDRNHTICSTIVTIAVASIPYRCNNSCGLPDRGISLTQRYTTSFKTVERIDAKALQ